MKLSRGAQGDSSSLKTKKRGEMFTEKEETNAELLRGCQSYSSACICK